MLCCAGLGKLLSFVKEEEPRLADHVGLADAAQGEGQHDAAKIPNFKSNPKLIPLIDLASELAPEEQVKRQLAQQAQQADHAGDRRRTGRPAPASAAEARGIVGTLSAGLRSMMRQLGGDGLGSRETVAVSELVVGVDGAGLEGFLTQADSVRDGEESSKAALPQEHTQRQPGRSSGGLHSHRLSLRELSESSLTVSVSDAVQPMLQTDTPLLSSALAAQGSMHGDAERNLAAQLEGVRCMVDGGIPELLYPPGRILLIFPADEDLDGGLGEGAGDGPAAAGAPRQSTATGREVELSSSVAQSSDADFAGQLPRCPMENSAGESVGEGKLGAQTGEAVHMGEALQAAAAASGVREEEEVKTGGTRRPAPLCVVAERASFERMLLLPDMLVDHLPRRYLQVIQQF